MRTFIFSDVNTVACRLVIPGHDNSPRHLTDHYRTFYKNLRTRKVNKVSTISRAMRPSTTHPRQDTAYNFSFVRRQWRRLALYLEWWEGHGIRIEPVGGQYYKGRQKWGYVYRDANIDILTNPLRCPIFHNCTSITPLRGHPNYLILLSVLMRIQWGMGLFWFCFLASFCLTRKVLWAAWKDKCH